MSDFLDRLTTDSGAAPSLLRPIVPSRFEPIARDAKLGTPEAAVGSLGAEKLGPPVLDEFAPLRFDRLLGPLTHNAAISDMPAVARRDRNFSAPLPFVAPRAMPAASEEDQAAESRDLATVIVPSEADLLRRVEGIAQTLRSLQGHPAGPVLQVVGNEKHSSRQGEAVENDIARVASSAPPRIVPESLPSRRISAAESGPTVNVTIGRIEVKAAQSPAPAPTAATARARVMSLEQYLQRRRAAGGGA